MTFLQAISQRKSQAVSQRESQPKHKDRRAFHCESAPLPQLMPDLAEFMTVKEAAQELGFTKRGVQMLVKKAKLESISVGSMYLVSKKSVKDYLDKTHGLSKNDPTRGKSQE